MELIAIREYARRKGCSDTAVRKAIAAGKIVKGVVKNEGERPLINPEIADQEWGKTFNPNYVSNPKLKKQFAGEESEDEEEEDDEEEVPNQQSSSTATIKRKHAAIKLQIDFLELKKKQGELVPKDAVYKGLYSAGQEMREHFLSLPDKVIDDIMAAKDRNEAYLILHDGISLVLDNLTDIQRRNFA